MDEGTGRASVNKSLYILSRCLWYVDRILVALVGYYKFRNTVLLIFICIYVVYLSTLRIKLAEMFICH